MNQHGHTRRLAARSRARTGGFSLVELMVALVIGMIAIIFMFQIFANAEAQKRATTGSGNASSNANTALISMQNEITAGGYGFMSTDATSNGNIPMNIFGCPLTVTLPTATLTIPIAPVTINPQVLAAINNDVGTDILLIAYGNNNGSQEGDVILGEDATSTIYSVKTQFSHNVNDWVIAAPPNIGNGVASCTVPLVFDQITAITANTASVTVRHGAGTGATAPSVSQGVLYNLGYAPHLRAFGIFKGTLNMCDFVLSDCTNAANWTPIVSDIVSLRAEYGQDNSVAGAMTGMVSAWGQVTPTTACGWIRTSAVRIAVVARNNLRNKDLVTQAEPTWSGAEAIDLSAGGTNTDWQHYRYSTLETIVPIRNIVWMGAISGC